MNIGMDVYRLGTLAEFDVAVDTLLANGFIDLRVDMRCFLDTEWYANSKEAVISAVAKGAKVVWGTSMNENPISTSSWPTFRAAILEAAQWAQDNGVYEFQLGNEEDYHVDNATVWPITLWPLLKNVVAEAKTIFTNGNVSYTVGMLNIPELVSVGIGDIDILASNIYMGNGSTVWDWKSFTDQLMTLPGSYATEFSLNAASIDDYSTVEIEQAEGVQEMIDYFKNSGMARALYFLWDHPNPGWGVLKSDGACRELWNVLIGANEMTVITDLQAVETALRLQAVDLVAKADAVAQAIVDLQAIDDQLDSAADVISVD